VWDEAARALQRYPEAVLTGVDADGYPFSVRVGTDRYDRRTGDLVVTELPDAIVVAEGPANLLCHHHDEKLWNLSFLHVQGRLTNRDGGWVFTTTAFPNQKSGKLALMRNLHATGTRYLARRGLARPDVNWTAIGEVARRAKARREGDSGRG
jgi:hypothetical protein